MAGKNIHELVNDRQYKFILEYLDCLNGSEAYRRVYPNASMETSHVESCRLLANPNVKAVIKELLDQQSSSVEVTVAELISNLKTIMNDPKTANRDKIKCIELLGKYLDMWSNDLEVNVQPVINVSIVDDDNKDIVIDEPIDVDYDDIDE